MNDGGRKTRISQMQHESIITPAIPNAADGKYRAVNVMIKPIINAENKQTKSVYTSRSK